MEIKVIRSARRKRTVSARVVGDTMVVNAPVNMPEDELAKIINNFKKRFERRQLKRELNRTRNLQEICQELNRRYFDERLKVKSIEYSTNQSKQFGSCNFKHQTIRISHRLAEMPDWVRDYVIVHEMAHILEPNHSPAFWDIVARYKLTERARGYLLAKGFESEDKESDVI
jgi:hypothetical protein